MAQFTTNQNLYKWAAEDTKQTTITESSNNAEKIDAKLVEFDAHKAKSEIDAHKISNITGLQSALDGKASKTQEAWKTAVLQNGWSGTLSYRKNEIGLLELNFYLTSGTVASLTTIASLPAGYRPTQLTELRLMSISVGGLVNGSLYVDGSGSIKVSAGSALTTGTAYTGSSVLPSQ